MSPQYVFAWRLWGNTVKTATTLKGQSPNETLVKVPIKLWVPFALKSFAGAVIEWGPNVPFFDRHGLWEHFMPLSSQMTREERLFAEMYGMLPQGQ